MHYCVLTSGVAPSEAPWPKDSSYTETQGAGGLYANTHEQADFVSTLPDALSRQVRQEEKAGLISAVLNTWAGAITAIFRNKFGHQAVLNGLQGSPNHILFYGLERNTHPGRPRSGASVAGQPKVSVRHRLTRACARCLTSNSWLPLFISLATRLCRCHDSQGKKGQHAENQRNLKPPGGNRYPDCAR